MFKIGAYDWVKTMKELTEPLGSDFWSGFIPATEQQMSESERVLKRKFDPEFHEFYRTIGYGTFSGNGGSWFWSPDEFYFGAGPAFYFITGSLTPGDMWATPEQHTALWISRGRENPNPARFTEEVMTLDGVRLYDLLQFGANGCAGYHQLYTGPEPAILRYCLLTESQTMEDRSLTFSEGLEKIIAFELQKLT
jgi:hypothetical protein